MVNWDLRGFSSYYLFEFSQESPKHLGSGLSLWLLSLFDQLSFMSDLDVQIPTAFDPFADANAEDSGAGAKEYVHIRIQQRNGRKSLTTVQGLKKEFSYNKILKDLKKEFCCNGTVVQDPELGQVIQLQGDQRKNVSTFLVQAVTKLSLSGNNFITLPLSITRLSEHKYFKVVLHLKQLHIHQKYAMQCIGQVSVVFTATTWLRTSMHLRLVFTNSRLKFDVMVPGSGIPEWFSRQSVDSSIKANQPWINIS
ncbi:hypothetical protein PVK06_041287 [Gossypium arboreum]|uniref:SUI1 domain-containing protein n=1 Tax=Gossypium arboreum TaxID=29729 RepID=A0ABR0N7X3_GOSAR|nr:hypothetical protein PVK06_041287 [Gossypium arboreum]